LRSRANGVCYDFRTLTPELARECQLMGLALWAWHPDEPEDLRRLLELGVHGIMTNRPDRLNEVLDAAL
jgi:glycerophosphoryl diester phosphodiesterase